MQTPFPPFFRLSDAPSPLKILFGAADSPTFRLHPLIPLIALAVLSFSVPVDLLFFPHTGATTSLASLLLLLVAAVLLGHSSSAPDVLISLASSSLLLVLL